eukprot:8075032-Alexandrium_andersonii.AAC.1
MAAHEGPRSSPMARAETAGRLHPRAWAGSSCVQRPGESPRKEWGGVGASLALCCESRPRTPAH